MTTTHPVSPALGGLAILAIVVFGLVSLAIYFAPLVVAILKKKRSVVAIGALNVLLGWSLIGWVIALVWALSNEQLPTIVVQNVMPDSQKQLP
jgi:hypothetical protein